MADIEGDLSDAAGATVRLPRNVYSYIRASYDSREKLLDWLLAIAAVAVVVYVMRDELRTMVSSDATPNAGLPDPPQANVDISTAFPFHGRVASDRIYTYNMPSSRAQKRYPGPAGTRLPANPSAPPSYDAEDSQI